MAKTKANIVFILTAEDFWQPLGIVNKQQDTLLFSILLEALNIQCFLPELILEHFLS